MPYCSTGKGSLAVSVWDMVASTFSLPWSLQWRFTSRTSVDAFVASEREKSEMTKQRCLVLSRIAGLQDMDMSVPREMGISCLHACTRYGPCSTNCPKFSLAVRYTILDGCFKIWKPQTTWNYPTLMIFFLGPSFSPWRGDDYSLAETPAESSYFAVTTGYIRSTWLEKLCTDH